MKKTLKKNRNNRNVKGGSAILVKHTQNTLSDAKKMKKKTESAVNKLNKAIETFKSTLKKLSTKSDKRKKKEN